MKVALIHPPHPDSKDDRLDPPMGLLYIAAHLQNNGIDVEVIDLSGLDEGFRGIISHADIYGITSYIATLDITERIAEICKKVNPDSKVVIGGAHASVRPDDFPYADKVVQGYGEYPMLSLCGKTAEVDLFAFPAFNLVNLYSYSRRIAGERSVPFLTSRGCPFKCTFCGLAKMHEHSRYKMMSSVTAANQFYKIKHELGINSLNFQDDIFTMGKSRLFEILKHVKKNNFRFRCMGRAGMDNEEVYKQLSNAGCEQVAWGIESGSQYILDRMKKQVKVKDNYDVIQWAKKYGIVSRAFFIIGFPGETRETLEETKRFIEWADPDQFFISSFVPYPGTDVANDPEKYGITNISYDYKQYYQVSRDGTGGLTIDTEWLSREQFRELELEFREWIQKRGMRGEKQDYESQHNNSNI